MKKWFLNLFVVGLLVFGMVSVSYGQGIPYYPANQIQVGWESVTTDGAGEPLDIGITLNYRVYAKNSAGAITQLGATTDNILVVTLTQLDKFLLGVEAYYPLTLADGTVEEIKSEISWSDNPAAVGPDGIWGITTIKSVPAAVKGLIIVK